MRWLQERGVTIWDEWADANGELGPVYGYQWRHWRTPDGREIDQIAQRGRVRSGRSRIRAGTSSRAWNPADVDRMALPPCHALFQFYVADGRLSCQMYQRSADLFLGVPFNIASYALLTLMVAQVTGLKPGEFVHTLGDAHLYLNHLEQAREQLARAPRPFPRMRLNPGGEGPLRLPLRGLHARGLRAASGDQGADRGVSAQARLKLAGARPWRPSRR